MRQCIDPAERPLGPADVAKRHRIGGKNLEYRHRIWAGPFAERPGLVPTHGPRSREANQREPARQPHNGLGPFPVEAEAAFVAARQGRLDSA